MALEANIEQESYSNMHFKVQVGQSDEIAYQAAFIQKTKAVNTSQNEQKAFNMEIPRKSERLVSQRRVNSQQPPAW